MLEAEVRVGSVAVADEAVGAAFALPTAAAFDGLAFGAWRHADHPGDLADVVGGELRLGDASGDGGGGRCGTLQG